MMQQGTNMPRGMSTTQQGMGMQQQSMNQMACTTVDEFDNAMQMWSMVLQGAQGCPDVEAEARAQLGALETWRDALQQTMSRAQSADPNTQQMAQNDLIQTCAKAHTAVMRAEQAFLQEYGQAQDEMLSNIGMGSIMGGTGEQTQQPWQQQQQYQPSYQGTGTMGSQYGQQQFQPSYQSSMEQQPSYQRGMSQYGAGSQYGQQGQRGMESQYTQQYQPSWQQQGQRGMESQYTQQYQPSYQSSMGSQQFQPSYQRGMQGQQYQPSYQSSMGRQQSYLQQTREPYTQAVSQVPYGQQGMSTMGETFGPAGFSRGSYYGSMGLQQYGEPVQHERIPEAGSAWRGSQMGMGGQTGMQGQGQMGMGTQTQSSRGSEQFGTGGQQPSRSSQMRQRNW